MWYFWEYDVIYFNSQWWIETRKIDGGTEFSEVKVQKNGHCNVCNRLKIWQDIQERPIVYENVKKMDIENLIIVAL